ncbi:hypothetical protein Nepgr_003941 [Nepenthes gracilis]|uniref:Uncharacterized protein n=1 Tax=Nepenthes gracilis TaxID=150966 RepID=A0AAD3S0I0_NEPGR|nr:hypothetical protein Nepgr_003941 [Nepenthes gracilis]
MYFNCWLTLRVWHGEWFRVADLALHWRTLEDRSADMAGGLGDLALLYLSDYAAAAFDSEHYRLASNLFALASDLCCPGEKMRIHVLQLSVYVLTYGCQAVCNSHPRTALVDFNLAFWRKATPGIGGFSSCLHADFNYVCLEWLIHCGWYCVACCWEKTLDMLCVVLVAGCCRQTAGLVLVLSSMPPLEFSWKNYPFVVCFDGLCCLRPF